MAQKAVRDKAIPIRLACAIFSVSETCYRYEAKNNAQNELIANWLIRLTDNNRSWGFGLCYLYLRNVKNYTWNHKRIYRIYRELELNLRIKPRKRLVRDKPDALVVPLSLTSPLPEGRGFLPRLRCKGIESRLGGFLLHRPI